MRHQKSWRKLNRNSSHREALFKNMAASLFRYEQITTTVPKAKELRRVAEPLITLSKVSNVANRRLAFARLRDRDAVTKLFDVLGKRYESRPGGYLRILKFGYRAGDAAPMALVQLVDRPEIVEEAAPGGQAETGEPKPKKAKSAAKKPAAEESAGEPTGEAKEQSAEQEAKPAKTAAKKAKPKKETAEPGASAPKKSTKKSTAKTNKEKK